ncbi:MAG: hypothetical protein LKM44_01710 [Wolbachia endosymbiont of Meromenopon meropis]|nr:hypothetical protein [Wolbachia endosymbiont of Meromenopon meropis]
MRIQLSRISAFIGLLGFIFMSYSSQATSINNELNDIQEVVRNFISSYSFKNTIKNMSPSTIMGLCIAMVMLSILFRGIIVFFMIMFGVLIMMLGSAEKPNNYLTEKFNFAEIKPNNTKDES